MSKLRKILILTVALELVLAGLHLWLNVGFDSLGLGAGAEVRKDRIEVGFLPVTCHLTCPVNHWIRTHNGGVGAFEPLRFNGFPEIKEALIAGKIPATFMLAPMAMALAQQGVPIKIVYLGHRDGTAMMVHKDSDIYEIADLRGKRIAIPNRFSNQNLMVRKGLEEAGLTAGDVEIVEMPPPDMPAALYAKAVDAITSGEPFMAQTEMDGYGRVLYQAKELWPDFISCVLVVRQDLIDREPERVQELVTGIAKSGLWLEGGIDHRMKAADAVAKSYYNQDPRLLRFVLSKPPDRVKYSRLRLVQKELEKIADLAREIGILEPGPLRFEDYADPRFSDATAGATPYAWEAP